MVRPETIRQEMLSYDFLSNSITNFAKTHGCSTRYVSNKIKEWGIPHKERVSVHREKNNRGEFTFKGNTNKSYVNETKKPCRQNMPKIIIETPAKKPQNKTLMDCSKVFDNVKKSINGLK